MPFRAGAVGEPLVLSPTVYTVNSTASCTTGTGTSGTLPYVVGLANADPSGGEIEFDPTVFNTVQTINLAGSPIVLNSTSVPETITGPAAGVTINAGEMSSVFQVNSGVVATISGLTIANGSATGDGGGVSNAGYLSLRPPDLRDFDLEPSSVFRRHRRSSRRVQIGARIGELGDVEMVQQMGNRAVGPRVRHRMDLHTQDSLCQIRHQVGLGAKQITQQTAGVVFAG